MKTLEFIYQDTQIAFVLGNEKNVMVNATEMAKAFGKRVEDYKRLDSTKKLIEALKNDIDESELSDEKNDFAHADVRDQKVIYSTNKATYFNRILALDFATWLDLNFRIWVFKTIEDILFGNYKRHWDAHIKQEQTKEEMESIKLRLITNPTTEDVVRYFQLEQVYKNCSAEKAKAIKSQYKLDFK
jgi:ABC-type Fe3+-citrate transport system substrate-binding protein